MVIMEIDSLGLELDIASAIYKAIAHDYCSKVSAASLTNAESEEVLDNTIYQNSKQTIDDIVNKVGQLLITQTGGMIVEGDIDGQRT